MEGYVEGIKRVCKKVPKKYVIFYQYVEKNSIGSFQLFLDRINRNERIFHRILLTAETRRTQRLLFYCFPLRGRKTITTSLTATSQFYENIYF